MMCLFADEGGREWVADCPWGPNEVDDKTTAVFLNGQFSSGASPGSSTFDALMSGINRFEKIQKYRTIRDKATNLLVEIGIPRTMSEALLHQYSDLLRAAAQKEYDSHQIPGRETWVLVPASEAEGHHIIGSTWSFDLKTNELHELLKAKARACAQGFSEQQGRDFYRKYSHAVGLDSLRIFFSACSSLGLEISEADYTTAYLNALIKGLAFMKQLEGFEKFGPNGEKLVCKLLRAIYGRSSSGLEWEDTHHSALISFGWVQCRANKCLFSRTFDDGTTALMCTYVDNLFMGFLRMSACRAMVLDEMNASGFVLNDLGPVRFSLGARIRQNMDEQTVALDQLPQIEALVAKYFTNGIPEPMARRAKTPASVDVAHLEPSPDTAEVGKWLHDVLSLGGALNWIYIFTRPDIGLALSSIMRHSSGASKEMFDKLLEMLVYLDNTKHFQLLLGLGQDVNARRNCLSFANMPVDIWQKTDMFGVADSSHGGPRPFYCALLYLLGPVMWRIKRHGYTKLSATESEWMAQSELLKMALIAHEEATFLGLKITLPLLFFCDNEGACRLSESDLSSKTMRHVATRLAFLQEYVDDGFCIVIHIDNKGMFADIGTKILAPRDFHGFRVFLVRSPHGNFTMIAK